MRLGESIRQGQARTEHVLTVEVRGEDELTVAQRRTRQVAGLLGFNTGQQTQIGTAITAIIRSALRRAGGGTLEFSLEGEPPNALSIRFKTAKPYLSDTDGSQAGLRMARDLVDDLEIESSDSIGTAVRLRKLLPLGSPPVSHERAKRLREALSQDVPKGQIQELREQNLKLRRIQKEFVLSELSLRQRIRQSALLTEVAAGLIGSESIAKKLQRCAEEIVEHLDVAYAQVWISDSPAGPSTELGTGLELRASAGAFSDELQNEGDVGSSFIGLVAQQRRPYSTNSILDDPQAANRQWAKRGEIEAFAGYPLSIEDRLMGVLAVYARQFLASDVLDTLRVVASQMAAALDREHRMEERERLLASERAARLRAERATQARDRLLAVVSHDLRNPLSAILTSAALLKRAAASENDVRWSKHVQAIITSAGQMKRLISDLVDLASLEAGHLALELSVQPAAPLVRDVVELHTPLAEARLLRLDASVDDSVPDVRCDRARIIQALSNLVGNAIKFTPECGIISLGLFRRGYDVLFAVTDTGPGIPEEDIAHVFESYWQARPSAGAGLGLGLSIAKGLVESQGGRIWVESQLGFGTTFFVSLPAQTPARTEERIAP